jgi:paraquat-inducible protein B
MDPNINVNSVGRLTTIGQNMHKECDRRTDHLASAVAPDYDELVEKMALLGNTVVEEPAVVPNLDEIIKAAIENSKEALLGKIRDVHPEKAATIAELATKAALKRKRSNASITDHERPKEDTEG